MYQVFGIRPVGGDCKLLLNITDKSVQVLENYHFVIGSMILSRFCLKKMNTKKI
jgi:hypothetical protein